MMLLEFFAGFLVTMVSLWWLRPLAIRTGLVDRPGGHKAHRGEVPLVGGIAMFLGIAVSLWGFQPFPDWGVYLFAAGLLVVAGVADDYSELHVGVRFAVQIAAGLLMVYGAGNVLWSLGDLAGTGELTLSVMAVPFTLFCVLGLINAMNMSDGMDGLAGSLALVPVMLLVLLVLLRGGDAGLGVLLLFPAVLLPFLVFNLGGGDGWLGRVFMGDAGSTFLGFSLAWMLIAFSQGTDAVIRPVTALWLMAVPLIDTVSLLIRRLIKGRSPFMADRQHFHHVLLAAGFSPRQALALIVTLALLLGGIGVAAEIAKVPEWQVASAFVVLGLLYLAAVQHAWRVKRVLSRLFA